MLAGLGYALSVRMLTELTTVSAEVWPMAVAPWLVIPLAAAAPRGSPRRWAALSGLAFLMAGGTNAVASAAILPLGALYLLSRAPGPRRRSLAGWWAVSIVLASLWWAVPLLLLGRYSPPFLDWIENAAITTGRNDPTTVLRGATQWVAYLADVSGPTWPGGWQLLSRPLVVAATGALALLGFTGLLGRRVPERTFLVLVLCTGLVLTSLGHVSASGVGGLGAQAIQGLLDGPLAPLRNVHKFQPLVTLPLMVGLGHLLSRVLESSGVEPRRNPLRAPALAGSVAVVIAVAATPAITGALVGGRSYAEIPGYWRDAAQWLDERQTGRALVIPAASFGVFLWGRTQDEPLQALEAGSWGVRDAVPLSSAGNIRLLDEIQRHLDAGAGSPGLAPALARSGVRWLVVRNDLDTRAARSTRPILLHQALEASPGLELVTTFGPLLSTFDASSGFADGGLLRTYPAVEVFAVQPDTATVDGRVALRRASAVTRISGSTEALVDVLGGDLLRSGAAIMAGDEVPPGAGVAGILTDTYRRSEANFGAVTNQYSQTLTDTDPFLSPRPVHDYLPVDPEGRQGQARLEGAAAVTASSSGSSPFALRGRSQAAQPWAALDGDPATAWISGDYLPAVGQWWQVDLAAPREVRSVDVSLVVGNRVGPAPAKLAVITDAGRTEVDVRDASRPQTIALDPGGMTGSVRIEALAVRGGGAGLGFGLAEVSIPGVEVARPVVLPAAAADGGITLSARSMGREGCAAADTAIVCDPDLASPGEERAGIDRVVDVVQGGRYRVEARLRPRPGPSLDAYLAAPADAMRVTASSQVTPDPAVRAQAAADGQSRTTWIAAAADPEPTLDLVLPAAQRVGGLRIQTAADAPASRPLEVQVTVDGVPRTMYLDSEGLVRFPAVTAQRISLRFGAVNPVRSIDSATGASRILPVGVTEVILQGGPDTRMRQSPSEPVVTGCATGPTLLVDGAQASATRVSTTAGAILEGDAALAQGCSATITLAPGVHRVRVRPTAQWLVEQVTLVPEQERSVTTAPDRPRVRSWAATSRAVEVPGDPGALLLETTENFNAGWQATLDGVTLAPLRVDGWRQAFLVPAGASGTVALTYTPDRLYRAGLSVGLVAVLVLVILAAVPTRRAGPRSIGPADLPRATVAAPILAALMIGGPLGLLTSAGAYLLGVLGARRRPQRPGGRSPVRVLGIVGLGASLAAQALYPWPGRIEVGRAFDLAMVIGPALALGALAFVGHRSGGPGEGPAARSGAS